VITGTNIEPPQAAAIPFEIESLITWFNKKISANYHVLEVACEFHQRFEELHPFRNGNGRVGRELINYFLERFEYPPVYLEKEDRENYLSALAAGNDDKLKPLVNLFFNKLMTNHAKFLEQVKETTETAKKFTPSIQTKLEDFIPRGEKDE